MRIDCFTHVMPPRYGQALAQAGSGYGNLAKLHEAMPELYDVPKRLAIMDAHGVDKQVITIAAPPIEVVVPDDPKKAAELARLANDVVAEFAAQAPDRFIPVGNIAMNAMDQAEPEVRRCIEELGMKGILIYANDRRRAIDADRFMPFYAQMADYDLPIWLHPNLGPDANEYIDEETSKYVIWQLFGWPFDTTAAMTRLIFAGVFDKHPNLKIITHHSGAMAPFFEKRIEYVYPLFAAGDPNLRAALDSLDGPIVDYYRKFYADTAVMGSAGALANAFSFFGSEHLLFGTDSPFDLQGGAGFTRDTITSIEALLVSPADKTAIYGGSLQKLIGAT